MNVLPIFTAPGRYWTNTLQQGSSNAYAATDRTATNRIASQASLGTLNAAANTEGDTFELSGDSSLSQTYDPSSIQESDSAGKADLAALTPNDPIRNFLDKVVSGIVTDEDLSDMQSYLQQIQQNAVREIAGEADFGSSQGEDSLQTFLDKVATGVVTQDNLTEMQNILQQQQTMSSTA